MDARYGLIIKRGDDAAKNTFTEWGIACMKLPFKAGGKTKEPAKRSYYDEHGEDTYLPKKLMFEAYDAEFELACVVSGNGWNLSPAVANITAFRNWITGNDSIEGGGCELKVYSPFSTIGRQGCYVTEIGDEDYHLQLKQQAGNIYKENVLTFKLKLRVTDPITDITLNA